MPGLRRLRDPGDGPGVHARARDRRRTKRVRLRDRLRGPLRLLHGHLRRARHPRPRAGARDRASRTARPDLSVWVVTGDGDALSIGGNHLIHALRRNVTDQDPAVQQPDLRADQGPVLADLARRARSRSRRRSARVDHPFNPIALALGAEATFVARTIDNDRAAPGRGAAAAAEHHGRARSSRSTRTATSSTTARSTLLREKQQGTHNQIRLEHGKPIVFDEGNRCVSVGENGRLVITETAEHAAGGDRGARREGQAVARVRARAPVARAERTRRASGCSARSSGPSTARP